MRCLPILLLLATAAPTAVAQSAPSAPPAPHSAAITDVHYRLQFDAAHGVMRSVGVQMTFAVRGSGPVLLSLPAWTPGAYEISDYARNVSGFSAATGARALRWDKLDPDTWRIHPDGASLVTVRFEARADSLDNAFNWARDDIALINGTNVFLYPEGQPLEFAAVVTVQSEPQWRVVTGISRSGNGDFTAPTYHELVDAPFFVGKFDLDSMQVAGRWMRLATYPAGTETGTRRAALWTNLQRSVPPQVKVFGETPWTTYTVMQIADSAFGGMSALEHQNSNVGIVGTPFLDDPFVPSVYAHEVFHAFNVKRLRPAGLWPYRYDVAQPTPWLWVSEGITDYYADLVMVRGGAITSTDFLGLTKGKMDHVAQLPPLALEDASLEAWLRIRDGSNGIYYDKGSLAGLALDILIRDATNNAASLDAVMRSLYRSAYKAGRGFTADDWWGAVSRAARGASFEDFNARYVDGREPYPWKTWLPKAGWRLVADTVVEARLGVSFASDSGVLTVTAVEPRSAADQAGVRAGDVLVTLGGVSASEPDFFRRWRENAGTRAGAPLAIEVRRAGQLLKLPGTVRMTTLINERLEDDPAATAKAVRIRTGILTGTVSTP
ncbi:MAG: M61 family metallopeptidase [Gemmatimonadaceae bacterium]